MRTKDTNDMELITAKTWQITKGYSTPKGNVQFGGDQSQKKEVLYGNSRTPSINRVSRETSFLSSSDILKSFGIDMVQL